MILESHPWREELEHQLGILESLSRPGSFSGEKNEADDFLFERSLVYSAFIVRLLMDSGKLPDSINDVYIEAIKLPMLDVKNRHISPVLRRWADDTLYDFNSTDRCELRCRSVTNQVIHSAIVPMILLDELGGLEGFCVGSDHVYDKNVFLIRLEDWLNCARIVENSEVSSVHAFFDMDNKSWTITRD